MERKESIKLNIVKKVLYFLPKLLYNMLNLLCIALIAIIVMQRFTDSNQSIGGFKIFEVVSGSMVPKYDVGEVVICKETPVEDIKVGNAIVYRGKLGELNGKIVMHEVIAINQDENNELKFYAKGLYNSKGDPEISESQILGVVKFRSSILTLLHKLASNVYVLFIIIATLVVDLFFSFKTDKEQEYVEKKSRKKKKRRRKKEIVREEYQDIEYDDIEEDDQTQDIEFDEVENDKELEISEEPVEELEEQILINEELQEKIDNIKRQVKEKKLENKEENLEEIKDELDETIVKQEEKKKTAKKKNVKNKKEEENVIDTKIESDTIKNVEKNTKKKSITEKKSQKSNSKKSSKSTKKEENDVSRNKKTTKKDS